jgi:hypothetical protein
VAFPAISSMGRRAQSYNTESLPSNRFDSPSSPAPRPPKDLPSRPVDAEALLRVDEMDIHANHLPLYGATQCRRSCGADRRSPPPPTFHRRPTRRFLAATSSRICTTLHLFAVILRPGHNFSPPKASASCYPHLGLIPGPKLCRSVFPFRSSLVWFSIAIQAARSPPEGARPRAQQAGFPEAASFGFGPSAVAPGFRGRFQRNSRLFKGIQSISNQNMCPRDFPFIQPLAAETLFDILIHSGPSTAPGNAARLAPAACRRAHRASRLGGPPIPRGGGTLQGAMREAGGAQA